jgi:hypothetical protein
MCSHKTNDILSRWRDTDGIILEEVLPGCSSWDEEGKARRVLQIRQPETHGIHVVNVHCRNAVVAGGEPRDEEGGPPGRHVPCWLRHQCGGGEHCDAHHRPDTAWLRCWVHCAGLNTDAFLPVQRLFICYSIWLHCTSICGWVHQLGLSCKDSTVQAAPLYLAETSPARWRGAFTTAYHFFLVAGTLAANVANCLTDRIPDWGWRVSLGLAAIPATVIVMGALFVPDTPSSLVLRGEHEKARASLQRIRGKDADVEVEFKDIVHAVEETRRNEEGAFERLRGKGYRHYLMMMVAIPTFFDLTGMIVLAVFSPVLFRTVGFNSQKAIFGAVIISLVSLCGVMLSTIVVDRCGRRFLFLVGGTAMMLFQVIIHSNIA